MKMNKVEVVAFIALILILLFILTGCNTVAGVGIIYLGTVATATDASGNRVYRVGAQTTGLSAAAGTPVRVRKLYKDDTLYIFINDSSEYRCRHTKSRNVSD
jgi:predicted small secreted protein